jgi:hypothetical protein
MRRGALLVLLLLFVGVVSSARGAAGSPGSGPRVTVFGDSVAGSLAYVPEARDLLGDGLDLRLELAPCRRVASVGCPYMGTRPPSVLDVVRPSSPAELGDIVVVDVGYNESSAGYQSGMRDVVQALVARGVGHVIWLTMREQTDNYKQTNSAIRAEASRWPQVEVADWDTASRGQDWFQSDGLHLNADGAVGLALFLRPLIFADCAAACRPASPIGTQPHLLVRPRLRGAPVVGRLLTCKPGMWAGTTPLYVSFTWLRDGRALPGARGRTRRLTVRDRAHRVACRVWVANVAGSARATSNALLVRAAP